MCIFEDVVGKAQRITSDCVRGHISDDIDREPEIDLQQNGRQRYVPLGVRRHI